jgi:hypothetical protein
MAVTAWTTFGGTQTAREGGTMKVLDSVFTRTAPVIENTS